ncbi:MAG: polysaccharide deacetylase family protein [Planctomycetia bacterium]|nr:polysaccharide deacetylase family protein [Planctomycetia bacterium]
MSALRQLLKTTFKAIVPPSWLLIQGPKTASSAGYVEVALTIDDGPHPGHTPRVLDLLAAANMKATFFVVGDSCRRYPDVIRRIAAEGHELGNHTWSHSEPTKTTTAKFLKETQQTRQLLQDLTGQDCRLTRPPKGELTFGKTLGLWQQQQTIVLWNVDPKDYAMDDREKMRRWCENYLPQNGDIVLLHDDQPYSATCLERLAAIHHKQTHFITISHWLNQRASLQVDCELERRNSGLRDEKNVVQLKSPLAT